MSSRLDYVLSRFTVKRKRGDDEYDVLCPVHGDSHASCGVKLSRNGTILVNCMAGCSPEDIVSAAGLEWKDLFNEDDGSFDRDNKIQVASYIYTDQDGVPIFRVVRYRDEYGKKLFQQHASDGKGGWLPNLGAINKVPYNLPDVVKAAKNERRVIIVEGEKDVHTLLKLGFVATTTPGGSGGWRPAYAEWFKGAEVVIIPDNDAPGKKYAKAITGDLKHARVLDLPGLRDKEDVTDWLGSHSAEELKILLGPETVDMNPCTWGEFQSETDKMRYLCGDIIAAQTVNMCIADGGLGKTTLLTQLCLSLAAGKPFLGIPIHEPVPVLLFEAEGARPIFRERAELCRRALGIPASDLDRWFIQAKELDEFRLSNFALERHIRNSGAKFVMLDTLGYFLLPGDENSSKDWKEYVMEPLRYLKRKYDCAFVVVHHEGKPSEFRKGHHQGRGTSAMFGDCDTWFAMEKRSLTDDDLVLIEESYGQDVLKRTLRERRLVWSKSKVGKFPSPVIMDFDFDNAYFTRKDRQEPIDLTAARRVNRYRGTAPLPLPKKTEDDDPFGS